jgi:hypothetical protein
MLTSSPWPNVAHRSRARQATMNGRDYCLVDIPGIRDDKSAAIATSPR